MQYGRKIFSGILKCDLKPNYGIIHQKTCQFLGEIVLYILNTPGKLLKIP